MGYVDSVQNLKKFYKNFNDLLMDDNTAKRYGILENRYMGAKTYEIDIFSICNFITTHFHKTCKDRDTWLSAEELLQVSGTGHVKNMKSKHKNKSLASGDLRVYSTIQPYYSYIDENNTANLHFILGHKGDKIEKEYCMFARFKVNIDALLVVYTLYGYNVTFNRNKYLCKTIEEEQADNRKYIDICKGENNN